MKLYMSYASSQPDAIVERMIAQLQWRYGRDSVYYNLHGQSLPHYQALVQQSIAESNCVLIIIDPTWLTLQTFNNGTDLYNPDTPIHIEVASALKAKKLIVPILINDAHMPSAKELPSNFASLTLCQAITIRTDPWFNQDMEVLLNQLKTQTSWQPASLFLLGLSSTLFILFLVEFILLRACLKRLAREVRKATKHKASHGQINHRLAVTSLHLIIFNQTTMQSKPPKCSLYYPTVR